MEGDLPIIQRNVTKPFPTWDIAILSVLVNPLKVEPESPMVINVTVENQGVKPADFDVIFHVNSSIISTQQIALIPGEVASLTFTWFPTEVYGLYMLGSMVSICPGETDTSDNIYYGPYVTVAFKADIDVDGIVGISDLVVAAEAFGSNPEDSRWNSNADVNEDNYVGIDDLILIVRDFGKTYP